MVATDTGKIGIIKRARESGTPVRTRYSDVREVLRSALCDPAAEKRILIDAHNRFEQQVQDTSLSNFRRDDSAKSLDVIDAFRRMRNQLAGHDFIRPPKSQPSLTLSGVVVPVNCDILIHRDGRGGPEIGAALFRLTQADGEETERGAEKRREMGAYAATLVHMHVAANLGRNRRPAHQICWSIDIQNLEVHVAPRTYASKAANLENACRFIAAMWDRV